MNASSVVSGNVQSCRDSNATEKAEFKSEDISPSATLQADMVKREENEKDDMETAAAEIEEENSEIKTPQQDDKAKVAVGSLATVVAKLMTASAESAVGASQNTSADRTESPKNTPRPIDLPLSGIETPLDGDILLGRGAAKNRHPGNRKYRHLVNSNRPFYATCGRDDKLKVVNSIHRALRADGCRFLEQESSTKLWRDVGDKRATDKIAQALREGQQLLKQKLTELLGHKEQAHQTEQSPSTPTRKTPPAVTPTTPPKVLTPSIMKKSVDDCGDRPSPPMLPNLMERRQSAPLVSTRPVEVLQKKLIRRALSVDATIVKSPYKKQKKSFPLEGAKEEDEEGEAEAEEEQRQEQEQGMMKEEFEDFSSKRQKEEEQWSSPPIEESPPFGMDVNDINTDELIGLDDLEEFDFEPLPATGNQGSSFATPPLSVEPSVASAYQKEWSLPIRFNVFDEPMEGNTSEMRSIALTSSPSFAESTANSVGVGGPSTNTVVTNDCGTEENPGTPLYEDERGMTCKTTTRMKRRRTSETSDGASTLTTVMMGCDDVGLSDDEDGATHHEHADLGASDSHPLGMYDASNNVYDYATDEEGSEEDSSGDPLQDILKNMEVFQARARAQLLASAGLPAESWDPSAADLEDDCLLTMEV